MRLSPAILAIPSSPRAPSYAAAHVRRALTERLCDPRQVDGLEQTARRIVAQLWVQMPGPRMTVVAMGNHRVSRVSVIPHCPAGQVPQQVMADGTGLPIPHRQTRAGITYVRAAGQWQGRAVLWTTAYRRPAS